MKKTAKTFWVWTEKAEARWNQVKQEKYQGKKVEDRIAGQAVYDFYGKFQKSCPSLWVEKGWVMDASEWRTKNV